MSGLGLILLKRSNATTFDLRYNIFVKCTNTWYKIVTSLCDMSLQIDIKQIVAMTLNSQIKLLFQIIIAIGIRLLFCVLQGGDIYFSHIRVNCKNVLVSNELRGLRLRVQLKMAVKLARAGQADQFTM